MRMKRFEDIPKSELVTKFAIFKVSDISVIVEVVLSMDEALKFLNQFAIGHYSSYEYLGSSKTKFDYWLKIPDNRYRPMVDYDLDELLDLRRQTMK